MYPKKMITFVLPNICVDRFIVDNLQSNIFSLYVVAPYILWIILNP